MAFVEWTMQGSEYGHCNCNVGCPCQFNALPSHGHCRAHSFFQIERGRFGDVRLDGLRWGFLAAWPGPIHLGEGTYQLVVEERADAKQRAAIEAVAQGKETDPGTLITQVFSHAGDEVAAHPVQADRARDRRRRARRPACAFRSSSKRRRGRSRTR